MHREKKNARFAHIGSVMQKVMGDLEKASGPLIKIRMIWPDAVGPTIAQNTSPVEIKGNILVVNVAGSVWLQELQFSNREIVEAINRAAQGEYVLADIQYRIGPVKK